MDDYSYIGSGRVALRKIGTTVGFVEVGNCSALNFAVTEDVKELKDFTQPGGGTYNEVRRINAVESTMTLHDLDATNLARALYGTASTVSTATITDEAHADVTVGDFVATDHLAASITNVKKGATVLVAGTDYEVRPSGIVVKSGGAIATGDDITITYAKAATGVVEMLTSAAAEYEMLFTGLNEARSGKLVRVRAYRVKIGALANLPLIGEEFAAMEVRGKLLKDTAKSGAGISQYAKIEIQA